MTEPIACLTQPFNPAQVAALPRQVTGLAVRADLAGDPDPAALRAAFSGTLIYLFPAGGGLSGTSASRRRERLCGAARAYDLVALDAEVDLIPEVLDAVPPQKRIPAWFGQAPDAQRLRRAYGRLNAIPAPYYLMTVAAKKPMDGLVPLSVLRNLKRKDVIAFAEGAGAAWSLPLTARFGSPLVFGAVDERSGTMSVRRLIEDYGLPEAGSLRELYGMVGGAVHGSLAPRLFNAVFRAEGRDALYLPFDADSFSAFFQDFMQNERFHKLGISLKGITVRSPFKEQALNSADGAEPEARACGGANMMVRRGTGWHAGTSDFAGVLAPLRARGITLSGLVSAVVGAGGAGRAAALALKGAGARVSLVHRDPVKGRDTANRLNLPFVAFSDFEPGKFRLVVHATPLGKHGEPPIFDPSRMAPGSTLLEYVYGGKVTPMMRTARQAGIHTVDGYEVLAAQLRAQFSFFTESPYPRGVMEDLISKIRQPGRLAIDEGHEI